MNNSLKNKLKADYEDLRDFPSDKLWEKINEKLGQESQVKNNFVFLTVWRYAAAILVLVGIAFIVKYNYNSSLPRLESTPSLATKTIESKDHKASADLPKQNSVSKEDFITPPKDEYLSKEITIDFKKNIPFDSPEKILEKNSAEIIPKQIIKENIASVSEPSATIQIEVPAEKIKYVTASELLFEREVKKTLQSQNQKLVNADVFQKPKEVKILGFTVYSDSQQ